MYPRPHRNSLASGGAALRAAPPHIEDRDASLPLSLGHIERRVDPAESCTFETDFRLANALSSATVTQYDLRKLWVSPEKGWSSSETASEQSLLASGEWLGADGSIRYNGRVWPLSCIALEGGPPSERSVL